MNIIKEAAVFIGDHITAPIRRLDYEHHTGRPAKIVRATVETDEGEYSTTHFEWFIVPKDATPREQSRIIEGW